MIRSMTGFGAASRDADGTKYSVEVRSLNNKFFKANVRLPEELPGLDAPIESIMSKALTRGSVVATVRFADTSAGAAEQINVQALQRYIDQLRQVNGVEHVDPAPLLNLPGVLVDEAGHERIQRSREILCDLTKEACSQVLAMRLREGEVLYAEFRKHCDRIAEHLSEVETRVPEVVKSYQQRLRSRMEELLAEVGATLAEEDLLREVAIFAERSDIAEEVSRLAGHLEQFREIIDGEGQDPVGRTLDFISQEMLREANTIGSKCMDVEIARRIVEIKSAIDRIKEQAQNVE